MINLSEAKKGEKIVDCFCGIGSIIGEALIQGIKAIGIDKDKKATDMAKKNLEWLKVNKDMYTLINGDAGNAKVEDAASLVSEPDLGEVLREVPSKEKAHMIEERYEKLITRVLSNMKHHVKGKFVFTAPYILAGVGRVSCNITKIAGMCKLKILGAYKEFRRDQVVGREIFVLAR